MNIQPLGDRVVIKPLEKEQQTTAGIYIPETASKEKPQEGEIIAIGPGKTLDNGNIVPLSVKVGDKVLFAKYGPSEATIEGQDVMVASEADILAIIK